MKVYGLIGYPLTHSFSKKYFTEKFEKQGLTGCRYENFSIASIDELPGILAANPDIAGLNVTIPYKETVVNLLGEKKDVVKKIGACNCIRIEGKRPGRMQQAGIVNLNVATDHVTADQHPECFGAPFGG